MSPSRRIWKTLVSTLLIVGILVLAVGAGYYIYMNRPQPEARKAVREQRVPVHVREVAPQPFRRQTTLLGTAEAVRHAQVAAQVPGYVVWLSPSCEPGQEVDSGEELVRIDSEPYRIALDQAEASLEEAEASVTLLEIENEAETQKLEQARADLQAAQNELNRKQQLHDRGVVSASELDAERQRFSKVKNQFLQQQSRVRSAEALLKRSSARRLQARAQRDRAAMELSRTSLRAPFQGTVASRAVDLGDHLQVGAEAFALVDYDTVVVQLEIPSRDLELARVGRRVEVSARQGRLTTEGVLRHVSPRAMPETRLFQAKVYVQNSAGAAAILPGQFVRVTLQEPEAEQRILAPFTAITQDGQGRYVYVVDPGEPGAAAAKEADAPPDTGTARKQYVDVLWQQGQHAVVSGLEPGAWLVIRGQEDLAPGAPVTILHEAPVK